MSSGVVQSSASSSVTQPMFRIDRLNVLEDAKLHLKIVGILPINTDRLPIWCKKIPIHLIHVCTIFLILTLYLCSSIWFFLFELKTFTDLTESVFWGSRSILSITTYSMFIWYKSDLIKFIDNLDEIVNKRKYSATATVCLSAVQLTVQTSKFSVHCEVRSVTRQVSMDCS